MSYFPYWNNREVPFSNSLNVLLSPRTASFIFIMLTISLLEGARSVPENCIASVEMLQQQLKAQACQDVIASMQFSPDDDLEPFDNITDHLSSHKLVEVLDFSASITIFFPVSPWSKLTIYLSFPCHRRNSVQDPSIFSTIRTSPVDWNRTGPHVELEGDRKMSFSW